MDYFVPEDWWFGDMFSETFCLLLLDGIIDDIPSSILWIVVTPSTFTFVLQSPVVSFETCLILFEDGFFVEIPSAISTVASSCLSLIVFEKPVILMETVWPVLDSFIPVLSSSVEIFPVLVLSSSTVTPIFLLDPEPGISSIEIVESFGFSVEASASLLRLTFMFRF